MEDTSPLHTDEISKVSETQEDRRPETPDQTCRITEVERSMLKKTHGDGDSQRNPPSYPRNRPYRNGTTTTTATSSATATSATTTSTTTRGSHDSNDSNKDNGRGTLKPSSFIIVRPLLKGTDGTAPPPTLVVHRSMKTRQNEGDRAGERSYPRGLSRPRPDPNPTATRGRGRSESPEKTSKEQTRHFARKLHAKALKLARYKDPYKGDIEGAEGTEDNNNQDPKQDDNQNPQSSQSPSLKRSNSNRSAKELVKRSPRVTVTPDTVTGSQYSALSSPRAVRASSRLSSHSTKTEGSSSVNMNMNMNISRIRVIRGKVSSREESRSRSRRSERSERGEWGKRGERGEVTENAWETEREGEDNEGGSQSQINESSQGKSMKLWSRRHRVSPQREENSLSPGPESPPPSSRSITLHWRRQKRVTPAAFPNTSPNARVSTVHTLNNPSSTPVAVSNASNNTAVVRASTAHTLNNPSYAPANPVPGSPPASIIIHEPWIQASFDLPGIESLLQHQTQRQEERYVQIRIQRYRNFLAAREKAMNDKYPIVGHLARRTQPRRTVSVWAPVRSAPQVCERFLSRQGLKRRVPQTEDEKVRPKTTLGIVHRTDKR